MSDCLIFLTNTYPFDGGEYFIENEIGFLSRDFDKVIICALDADSGAPFTRPVPGNAAAFITGKSSRKGERAKDLMKAAASMVFGRKKVEKGEMGSERDIRKGLFEEYFLARTQRQLNQVLEKLEIGELKEYDRVIIYSYWLFVAANVAVKLRDRLGEMGVRAEKVISRAHGYDIYEERNPLNYLPQREFLLGNLDRVFTCSEHGEKYLKEKYPAFSGKIEYSPLGTTDHGKGKKYGGEEFLVVTCSSLSPVKRVWKVADALSLYRGERTIKWVHIGGSGKKLRKLEGYAVEKLSGVNVKWEFTGQISNDRVTEFYLVTGADLFLNVSESEGVPVSIMEAASFGVPVVATDCGGTGETVVDSVTGKLLGKDFTDRELLFEIEKFMSLGKDEAEKISEAAREMWMKKYSAEKNYSGFTKRILS